MIPLPMLTGLPWRAIGWAVVVALVALAGWRVSAWHTAYEALLGLESALEAEKLCREGSACAQRVAALEARQQVISSQVVESYEQELANLRGRTSVRRVIRVCAPATDGDVRDASGAGGTAAAPADGVVLRATEFDPQPLFDLARRADEMSAAYRALRARDEALSQPAGE